MFGVHYLLHTEAECLVAFSILLAHSPAGASCPFLVRRMFPFRVGYGSIARGSLQRSKIEFTNMMFSFTFEVRHRKHFTRTDLCHRGHFRFDAKPLMVTARGLRRI